MNGRQSAWDIKSEKSFWWFTAFLFAALVLINYFPVLGGQIPLPGALVTQFPAWEEFQSRQPRTPVADIGDLIDYFYPYNAFSAQQVRSGTIPLWNPYVMSGYPFQAEPQTAMFYPLHVVYYLFSTPVAWTIALIARAWLAAMFMTLLIRSIGGSKTGAIIAGMAFAFGGFVVAWQGTVMGDAVIWLPLMCYSVVRLHRDHSVYSLSIVAFSFAMPVLAGHPETAIHVILTGSVAAFLIWAFPTDLTPRFDMAFFLKFSVAGFLAAGLACVQLLPTLEWVMESSRNLDAVWPSFPLHEGLGFFSRDILRGPNSVSIFVPNSVGYVGMLTLLIAAAGLLYPKARYVVWFAGLIAFGLAATFGIEPVHALLTHLPVIRGLKNERLILLVDFGLAALAGLGISVLEDHPSGLSKSKRRVRWLMIGLMFLFAFFCVYRLRLASQVRVEFLRRPSFSRAMLLAGVIVVVWKLIRGKQARLFPLIACGLLAFDLLTFTFAYTGFTPRDEVFPQAPVFDFLKLQGKVDSFRFARAADGAYASNSGIAYGLQSLTGFEAGVPLPLKRFTEDFTEDLQVYVSLVGEKILALKDRRLDMLNVKYLVVVTSAPEYRMFRDEKERFSEVFKRGEIAVFENKRVLPRALLVGMAGIRVVPNSAEQLRILKEPTFDPERNVILDKQPVEFAGLALSTLGSDFMGRVEIVDSDANSYRFRVEASTPAVLIVSQNLYPGWKATINGSPAAVFAANHALTGIAVPEGNYDLVFEFDPLLFKVGALLSVMSVVILGGWIALARRPVRE